MVNFYFIVIIDCFCSISSRCLCQDSAKIIDGKRIKPDDPYISNDRTLVPIRVIAKNWILSLNDTITEQSILKKMYIYF